jgi:hypothetical protein
MPTKLEALEVVVDYRSGIPLLLLLHVLARSTRIPSNQYDLATCNSTLILDHGYVRRYRHRIWVRGSRRRQDDRSSQQKGRLGRGE